MLLVATILASCAPAAPTDSPPVNHAESFATLVQGAVSFDYDPSASPADLLDKADLVVVGEIESVVAGRTLPYGRNNRQVNLVVLVDDTISGTLPAAAEGRVYVELTLGSHQEVADFQQARPTGRVLLFLGDRTFLDGVSGETGRPVGQPIYAPHPEGLLIESSDGLVGGLVAIDDLRPGWGAPDSIDEVIAALAR